MAGCECCDNFSMIDGGDEFKAFPGLHGNDGTTYYPHVSSDGIISWTNDGGKPNPDPVNIKGTDGKSAYQAAVESGFTGTEEEFNEYLSGIGDLTDEVADQKSAIEALDALVDRKAGMLVDTASGAIASFVPDATIDHLLGLDVNIEPVQDLHGFDEPWPGGAKVSKCPTFANGTHALANGVTITIQDGKITINGTPTAAGYWEESIQPTVIPDDAYITFNNPVASQYVAIVFRSGSRNAAITVPQLANRTESISGAVGQTIDALQISFNGQGTFSNFELSPIVHLGSTPKPYSQYSNICPISGWDAVEIERAGVNLLPFPYAYSSMTLNGITWTVNDDGSVRAQGTATGNSTFYLVNSTTSQNLSYLDGKTVMLSGCPVGGGSSKYFVYQWHTGGTGYETGNGMSYTFTVQNDSNITLQVISGNTVDILFKPQLEIGNVKTEYKQPTGTTYTITLGQTVYGGVLDATNGTMTVDKVLMTLNGTEAWAVTSGLFRLNMTGYLKGDIANGISSAYPVIAEVSSAAQVPDKTAAFLNDPSFSRFMVRDNGYATVADFKAALAQTPMQVAYTVAEPITIQLDPVQIATIAHQTNNVWADAGDVTVEYAADIKAYIDRMNQPTEDDMIANTQIASDKYFTVNNRLFLSTASIAAGSQIIPGTNCTETSLVEALNALNA